MKALVLSVLAAGSVLAVAAPASAFPGASKSLSIETPSQVTEAGWRCGRGWHWSVRWRRCVRNW